MFIAIIFLLWQYPYIFSDKDSIINFHMSMSIFVPIVFLVLGASNEKGIFSKSGSIKLIISLVLVLLGYGVSQSSYLTSKILLPIFHINIPLLKPASEIGLFLFLIALIVLIIKDIVHSSPINKILPFALLSACLPFLVSYLPYKTPLFLSISLFLLGSALFVEAYKMAYIDPLTQIPSRRAMDEYTKGLIPPYSLTMVDIDFFKKFNDNYGHKVGDEVLKFIAKELKQTQGGCKAFRYGGEEFCLIFSKKHANEVKPFLEQTREKIASKGFGIRRKSRKKEKDSDEVKQVEEVQRVSLSVSMGVCDTNSSKNINELFVLADKALYKAKQSGRNRVVLHELT